MQYRLLGRSGLKVSALSLGSANYGNGQSVFGSVDLKGVERQIDLALDHGVNMIDTANVYAETRSESFLGEALTAKRRKGLLLATKVRFPVGKGPNDQGLSRYHIIREAEASLKRLKTDVIDLHQVHEWDGNTPLEETMEALDSLVRAGKVRYIGCSNYSAWHIMKALAISDKYHYQRFVSQQIHYTLQARDAEHELIPVGLDQGVSLLIWSGLGGGWLTGKYTRHSQPTEGRQTHVFREPPIYDWDKLWDIVDVLIAIAKEHNATPAQISLAWTLQRPAVASVILGGTKAEQIESNLKAIDIKLLPEDIKRLDEVSLPNLPYPLWHQAFTVSDRMEAASMSAIKPYLGRDLTVPMKKERK